MRQIIDFYTFLLLGLNGITILPIEGNTMILSWVLIFLIGAIIAGALGFGGISADFAGIARILFIIFIVLLIISLIGGI